MKHVRTICSCQQMISDDLLLGAWYWPDESMAREPEPFNRAALKTGQQRLKDAKKKYQAELLKQMQERAAERELEKSRRKQEDEQERIRLSREIEQERLAKEEEDACQLIRSKHLAEANVAAARLPKQQQPHQTPSTPFDADAFSRQAPTGSNRIMRSREGIDQRPRENTISAPSETILQKDPENERRGHDIPCDRFVQQMPVGGAEAERCLLLGLEALQAEVRMQTEEMRYLKNQQRRVLQHIHQGTAFRSTCCERRCCPADAGDSCVWYPAAHPRSTAVNTKITTEQNALRDQYAFATTVLKNAGIPDPEGVMRRLAESGAIPISCGPECPGVVPVNRPSCQYNTAAPGRPDQLEEGHSTRDGQLCGVPHCSSVSMSLSRGLSNTSCCSIHTGTHDALPRAKDEYPNIKREGTQTEDPEDRPLPTLVKRLQQPVQTQQQPVSHLGAGVVHQQREQLHPQPTNNVKRPDALAEKETDTDADVDAQAKREPAGERSCREAARTKLNTSADMPVDRRWRFNELWACLSHGFPPPPALGHFIRVSDKDGEDALSESNSWCTSECESELPCQTILLQQTPDCTTPPVGKRLQQCMARQLETFSKDGWLPSSQMETLEESTAQTYMPEEQGHVSRPAQALYDGFVSVVGGGMANEAISVASETARLTSSRKTEVSLFEKSNGPQERQPLESSAAVDISGSTGIIREDQLCSTSDQQIYRALSVDAAPLKLQQLRQWDSQIRHRRDSNRDYHGKLTRHSLWMKDSQPNHTSGEK
ncbi:hypothetical protein, conserved [Eimeria maxima]|uniref:CCDC66 domain-containing protein n=1 Tax=Eimeria maxima TaxID=5804 RepID=U6MCJ4_EIMMA|nr:hypothetical protein, conserved [Eimeria maxima]CDJ60783.1 hypothetical protein, conserved [Eimeria maxima]